ncbi:hypothetical protein EDB19DRAFT_1832216 [Suillus lakei]|nr:hypothetical protein EDB19DRAFT_1832216 [Suillus lakei]
MYNAKSASCMGKMWTGHGRTMQSTNDLDLRGCCNAAQSFKYLGQLRTALDYRWDLFEGDKPEDQLEPEDLPSVLGLEFQPKENTMVIIDKSGVHCLEGMNHLMMMIRTPSWKYTQSFVRISMGLAIEEAQIALLIEVRRIGRRTTETQRLDIAQQCDHLQGQIDGFTWSALTHLGEGFDADDDPDDLNVDILNDLDDDPDDFTKTSDTWTNSPKLTVIPLPSNLGVDQCRHCMAEDLIPLEMSIHEGQANDALHNL